MLAAITNKAFIVLYSLISFVNLHKKSLLLSDKLTCNKSNTKLRHGLKI